MRIVISFIVLLCICQSFSLVHFKNGPVYLIRGTTKVFIDLMIFLLLNLISKTFSFVWDSLLLFFSFFADCLMLSSSNIPKYSHFLFFSRVIWFFLDLSVVFLLLFLFPLLILSLAHFLCQSPPQYPDCIFLLFVLESLIHLKKFS